MELKTQMYKIIGYLLTRRLYLFKMTTSGYNALLKPSISGTANVLIIISINIFRRYFQFPVEVLLTFKVSLHKQCN